MDTQPSTDDNPRTVLLKDAKGYPIYSFHIDTSLSKDTKPDSSSEWAQSAIGSISEAMSKVSDTGNRGFKLEEDWGYTVLSCNQCPNTHVFFDPEFRPDVGRLKLKLSQHTTKDGDSSETKVDIKKMMKDLEQLRTQNISVVEFKDDDDGPSWEDPCLQCIQLLCYDAFVENDPKALTVCGIGSAVVIGSEALALGTGISSAAGA
ncbi:hypothetical protein L486_00943 [Kwoniella mangroviensis CBS 10435]|uniref:Uncharacterized protein n=1 Tax=Kwoniella mangroviensis CBS 10435 TaxID=1331196 RepID=A0A1B9J0I7_9TREE|nr:hypothetical protein L486_00943 [Kwoniella mangroviensis CBS 10435]